MADWQLSSGWRTAILVLAGVGVLVLLGTGVLVALGPLPF